MIQPATFQETLRFIWKDQTSFDIYGTEQKKTKKQVYQEILGKKARKGHYTQYHNLRKKERNQRHYRNPHSLIKNGSCRDAYCSIADRRFEASKS